MKYNKWIAILCFSASICACRKDSQEETDAPKASEIQLSYLKHSLLYTDEQGEISLLRGVALDAADPTNVSLSVEDLEDAGYKFHELFYEDTPYSDLSATYTLDDNCGTARLIVNDTPVDGVVAYAEFDIPEIPQITRLNYVLESSWPENAAARGYYKKGHSYQMKGWDKRHKYNDKRLEGGAKDKKEWFVCLREDKDGNPALLVAISDAKYELWWGAGSNTVYKRVPSEGRAKEIQQMIRSEWGNYCSIYNANVSGALTDDQRYWIDSGNIDWKGGRYRNVINLYSGQIDAVHLGEWKPTRLRALLFREEPTPKKTFI